MAGKERAARRVRRIAGVAAAGIGGFGLLADHLLAWFVVCAVVILLWSAAFVLFMYLRGYINEERLFRLLRFGFNRSEPPNLRNTFPEEPPPR
jgi:hypothetical protein